MPLIWILDFGLAEWCEFGAGDSGADHLRERAEMALGDAEKIFR